jgi:hypothetical protein
MTIESTIKQYETLKIQIAKLEKEADALKPAILAEVTLGTKIESEYGTLTVQSRSQWEYSETVKSMEERLKAQKKEEMASGEAVEVPGAPYLVFKQAG